MYANKIYAWNKVVKGYHPLLRFWPAMVLGPADRDLLKPSSIRSKWVVCSFISFLTLIWPLKIFFMPSQMEDLNALESASRGYCQKASSSSSTNSSSEEYSAGTSSGWILGVYRHVNNYCMHQLSVLVQQILGHMKWRLRMVGNSYTNESLIQDASTWHL